MSYKQLTQEQRYYISQEYRNQTQAEIARKIGCSKSTVSRELKQHSINGEYRYPDEKKRIGDWELDTIVGKEQKSCLLVATERVTKFTVIRKLESFKAEAMADTVIRALAQFGEKVEKVKTLTLDNGKEFYRHRKFAEALNAQTYFCRPYHSWEKGLVENTNGLIRQYFPKQTDFREITDDEIQKVADNLNHRPRKTLGYETPSSLFLGIFKPLISGVALEIRM